MVTHRRALRLTDYGPVADMGNRTCRIKTCPDAVHCRGWCSKHYQAWRKHGDPLARGKSGRPPGRSACSIEGCGKQVAGLGWCSRHYTLYRKHGDPEWVMEPGALRRYALDDAFFDIIDTEAKAYWLGFVTADGCVEAGKIGANGWRRYGLSIRLKPSDAGHLEKFKADIAATHPVHVVPRSGEGYGRAEISLSSRRLAESLIALGVTPRKSLTATPWNGSAHLMCHYWRGMVDGDGTIVKHSDRDEKWQLRLIGSRPVVEAFSTWACSVTGSAAKVLPKVNIWSWTAGGLASPQALARELYGDATVYLDRKHALAHQLMAAPIRHRSPVRKAA